MTPAIVPESRLRMQSQCCHLDACAHKIHASIPKLIGKLHDPNRILRHKPDQNHQPDSGTISASDVA